MMGDEGFYAAEWMNEMAYYGWRHNRVCIYYNWRWKSWLVEMDGEIGRKILRKGIIKKMGDEMSDVRWFCLSAYL